MVLLIGALLLFCSGAINIGTWNEQWQQAIGAFLWMSGLSTLALGLLGQLV